MKKLYLILMLLISLMFMGCNDDSKKKKVSSANDIQLEVTLAQNMTSSHPLDVIFKLTNLSDKTVYYDNWNIPFNDKLATSLSIFKVTEDGVSVKYKGAFVYFSNRGFNSLDSGESFNAHVSIDRIYAVTKGTHNYTISFIDSILAKTSDNKLEVFDEPKDTGIPLKPNELGPQKHTSKTVKVKSNTLEFEANINEIRKPYEN